MGTILIVVIIILAIIIGIPLWCVSMYNTMVRLKNSCDEAFSTMDVYLKKRFDLIPNLVETVKAYAAHEKDTLDNVTKARTAVMDSATPEEKIANENALTGTLKSLFAVAENYPDLKASQSFIDLQGQLQKVEEDIANSRKYYNAVVKELNTKTEQFPTNIIASMFHFTKRPMFEVGGEEERQNVNVEF